MLYLLHIISGNTVGKSGLTGVSPKTPSRKRAIVKGTFLAVIRFLFGAAGQSVPWKYKAIYLQPDSPVGPWSEVVSLPAVG